MLKHEDRIRFEFDGVIGTVEFDAEIYENIGEEGDKLAEYAKLVKAIRKLVEDFEVRMLDRFPFEDEEEVEAVKD